LNGCGPSVCSTRERKCQQERAIESLPVWPRKCRGLKRFCCAEGEAHAERPSGRVGSTSSDFRRATH
jgi:hypothetical protein